MFSNSDLVAQRLTSPAAKSGVASAAPLFAVRVHVIVMGHFISFLLFQHQFAID
jgi:hypothetical protein